MLKALMAGTNVSFLKQPVCDIKEIIINKLIKDKDTISSGRKHDLKTK